jgi:hypothetical protein
MAISKRGAMLAGRAWAEERWNALPSHEHPRAWPGTLHEASWLPIVGWAPNFEGRSSACALRLFHAAEIRWRELYAAEETSAKPILLGSGFVETTRNTLRA